MDNPSWLQQAFVFLVAALVSVPIAKRLGLGSVLGYLIAGTLIGPFGLSLLGKPEGVMHVAEFGVVIMLFLIGLEIRPEFLWRMRGAILGLGGLQVSGCALALGGLALAAGMDWRVAVAVGLILAQSSTAIVLQSMRERGLESATPGRAAFAVLLFQDISVIPTLAVLPLLASGAAGPLVEAHGSTPLANLPQWAQAIAVPGAIVGIVVAGRYAMRPLFRFIAKSGLREIFTAAALALVVGVSLLMESVGLSSALGAFVAGVVLADSEYRHELESDIEPFRGLLLGLFFISVGASIDFALLARQPLLIVALVASLVLVKTTVLFLAARIMRHSRTDAIVLALALAQGGEFAFVLFSLATQSGVLSAEMAAPLVAAVALSMAATPLLFMLGARLAARSEAPRATPDAPIENNTPHAVIAGYGRFGQVVSRLLVANGFRTSVMDHSADHIEMLRRFGSKASYGDASRVDLLRAAGAETAQLLVIAVDEQEKALEIADIAHKHFPHLNILARAFDRPHAYELMHHGITHVFRETFDSALALGTEALHQLGMRAHQAERAGRLFRRHDRRMLMELAPFWGDEKLYRNELQARNREVERVMTSDYASFNAGLGTDQGWDTGTQDEQVGKPAKAD